MGLFDKLNKLQSDLKESAANKLSEFGVDNTSFHQTPSAPSAPATPSAPAAAANTTQSTGLYSEKIEKLIDFALADGVLTEKEKQVLFKKAEQEGIDLDEFEMVLESKLYEQQQSQMKAAMGASMPPMPGGAPAGPAAPQSNKYGDVRKCPQCGHVVQAMEAICPECGHEFANVSGISSIERLMNQINELSANFQRQQSSRSAAQSLVGTFTNADLNARKALYSQMARTIEMFPIPNAKADLYEFIICCANNSNKKIPLNDRPYGEMAVVKAWKTKAAQAYDKSLILLKNDPKSLQEIQDYLLNKGFLKEETKGMFKKEKTGRYIWVN